MYLLDYGLCCFSETSKARACLEAVERNSLLADDMKTALRLAKLTIFLKEDHLEYAESCLKDYVQDVTVSYTEAKAAVRRWLDHFLFRANTTPDIGAKITEVFKVFASRFPRYAVPNSIGCPFNFCFP